MNCLPRILTRTMYTSSIKKPIAFNMIPYHEQYESRDNENEIRPNKSYGEWIKENLGTTTRQERQIKMKEFLDKFYSTSYHTNE